MRNYLLIMTFFLLGNLIHAQKISLIQGIKRDLVQSISNPFSLIGKNCENYIVSCDNGKVEQIDSTCKYSVIPLKLGVAKIAVRSKSGKLILEENYHVKAIEFSLRIHGFDKNIDDLDKFVRSARFELNSNDMVCLSFSWDVRFELIIMEDNNRKIIKAKSQDGKLDEVKEYFSSLKKGNIIIFRNINVLLGEKNFEVPDIVLETR